MNRKRGIYFRAVVFFLLLLLFCLCPNERNYASHHWSEDVSWLNTISLYIWRNQCIGPLCSGSFVFLLLGCLRAGVRDHSFSFLLRKSVRTGCIVLACVLIVAGGYWTWGFCYYGTVLWPMPFEAGLYAMTHTYVLCIWWRVAAVALHISTMRTQTAAPVSC